MDYKNGFRNCSSWIWAAAAGLAFALFLAGAPGAMAYDQYSLNRDATNCRACHGDFRASNYVSLVDGQSWGNLHDLHRNTMLGGDCNACHSGSSRFPTYLGLSAGGSGLSTVSCLGCHGRSEDAGHDDTSAGLGAGLRQHHTSAGVTVCQDCHSDASATNYKPVGENVKPPYYANPGTNHPNMPTDPCNRGGKENFAGAPFGLDNDGDGRIDGADLDCRNASSVADFDGDKKADLAVFRPSNLTLYVIRSLDNNNASSETVLGMTPGAVVTGDFDGDGRIDVAGFESATGAWTIHNSGGGTTTAFFGTAGDIPAPADFDGDGKTDIAVFRPSNGTWYAMKSGGGLIETKFGISGDIPVPADYDYDGKADLAVFRPSNGTWYAIKSGGGLVETKFGTSGDVPVPGDYDGDGKTDLAVWRPSNGKWYVVKSGGGLVETQWGAATDVPLRNGR